MDDIYAHLWNGHGHKYAVLDGSLAPRSWTYMFEVASGLGLGLHSVVADIGCGRGNHCFELAERFGCQTVGVDLVLPPLQNAAQSDKCTSRNGFVQGTVEQLPIQTGSIDLVWCRDMLVHVANLDNAFQECSRVLRPGGKLLAWVTTQSDAMEPREAEGLYTALAIEPESLCKPNLETSFSSAGFALIKAEEFGSELIEFYEERDGRASRDLMRLARMSRMRERLVAEWGQTHYDTIQALYHWLVYHLLGKLSSGLYLLEKIR